MHNLNASQLQQRCWLELSKELLSTLINILLFDQQLEMQEKQIHVLILYNLQSTFHADLLQFRILGTMELNHYLCKSSHYQNTFLGNSKSYSYCRHSK